MLRFPAPMLNSSPDCSAPGTSLRNGATVRATSVTLVDSTRTTVAPRSAIARVVCGPDIAHVRSSTFTPSSGNRRSAPVALVADGVARNGAPSTSSVCSPRRGARPSRMADLSEPHANGPGTRTGRSPRTGSSTSSQKSRSANWVLSTTSSGSATGAINSTFVRAASSSSIFVLVRQNASTTFLSRSYSETGSRPS